MGEHVYFVAASQTTGLDHGMQGEVVGPALAGKGVTVLFPGDKLPISCEITEVRCHHALYSNPQMHLLSLWRTGEP